MNASKEMQEYFNTLKLQTAQAHTYAQAARKQGYDPEPKVEISLAKNMAERVVGLISVVAPQIANAGVVERIIELEKQYGALDWRVALKIAEEIALEKFCKFQSQKEAIEVGIRTGFAYSTVGVVSSPLDGLVNIEFKPRNDGKGNYLCVNYSGPIRNAGGTNAAVSVLIADYVRKKMGYATYDVTPEEIKRAVTELQDYHERITNLQYVPSDAETDFLMRNMPVEVSGEPSETIEVSNYKDLPRVPTNLIRSGYCLIYSSCIPLKAPKLWKQLSKWGKDFGLEHWNFLEQFLIIQKKAKSQGETKSEKSSAEITPDFTYIHDIVAGRPVFCHPLRAGGFRLRYGRSRTSGYSSYGLSPATMIVSQKYIATGTQLKLERPGKGTVVTACNLIEGPIVKLTDGSVVKLKSIKQAKEVKVQEILFLGDILINYGDFFNRAHPLVPAGYCPEWWIQELEKSIVSRFGVLDQEKTANYLECDAEALAQIFQNPLNAYPIWDLSKRISERLDVPLHPSHTFYWNAINRAQLKELYEWLENAAISWEGTNPIKIILPLKPAKRVLEEAGIPHSFVQETNIVIEKETAGPLLSNLGLMKTTAQELIQKLSIQPDGIALSFLQQNSQYKLRDLCGTFIGARMGRPEKAKMRKMTGSPHMMFPIGKEGGKFRSLQAAMEKGTITSEFPIFNCTHCSRDTIFSICDNCWKPTTRLWNCQVCGKIKTKDCVKHGKALASTEQSIPIKTYFENILKHTGMKTYPDLIKGVKGTSNDEHIPEHPMKGILRAKHSIHVNKDGTTRYDMTQLPITHFKPKETGTSIEKLKILGYEKDIHGSTLENDSQILELKPQDVILPSCKDSPDEGADQIIFRTSQFIDDELQHLYGKKPFYRFQTPLDCIGHLVVCLAPHTSAGIIGRIIGFSKTQGFFAHPLLHAATRRDCDGDEAGFILLLDAFLNFSKHFLPSTRGATMDAPLVLTTVLVPSEVDDMIFDIDMVFRYPLELYEAAQSYKMPWEVKILQMKEVLDTPKQYEGMGFTHDINNLNVTVRCSAYKTLPTMEEKLNGQMELAEKIRATDTSDVARLVIEKHFLKDIKGNLRKFSMQEFRCIDCNEKFRRPPLIGICTKCKGKLVFTISEGSITKYLQSCISLSEKYNVSPYLKQTIELLQVRIESVFGKEKERQLGLAAWA